MGLHERVADDNHAQAEVPAKLVAGALFVLKSQGSWLHCGYHLTTSIVAPPLLSLPLAFAYLGWVGGIVCLACAAVVTFYSYNLLSLVLEHHAQQGRRLLRFREMASHVLGPKWARYYIFPIQTLVCYGAVVGMSLLGGQTMKSIYLLYQPDGSMQLYQFIIIFGAFMLILAQIPSFHSLRHLNLVSLILCLAYSACATAGSINVGKLSDAPAKDYSPSTSGGINRIFGIFNAVSLIATCYGNGIIPEIQATVAAPVKGKMIKGLCLCYAVVISTFFSVAVSGYWAFGNQAQPIIISNFFDPNEDKPFLSKGFILMTSIFVLVQLSAVAVIYLQLTNEILEGLCCDANKGQYSLRNVVPRLVARTLSVVVVVLVAAMLPFFGDMLSVIGALGFLPLDFVIPAVMYNVTFKPSSGRGRLLFWINAFIAAVFSVFAVVGSVASIRQVVIDAKNYRLFANI